VAGAAEAWWRILTEAIVQHRFRGIDDPDQAWILGEFIRYLDDEKSGASGFEGLGQDWVRVRESARNETLRPSDAEAKRWLRAGNSSSSISACISAKSWGWMSAICGQEAGAPRNR
jgi:hypothetical protein